MESSNAWDRAQRAITRAEQRNATVITPDNAESPFDASATTILPSVDPARGGRDDADTTQRLTAERAAGTTPEPRRAPEEGPQQHPDGGHPDGPGGRRRRPDGVPAPEAWNTSGRAGGRPAHLPPEPPTEPVEVSDPTMVRVAPRRPDTSPFPAADAPDTAGSGETPPPAPHRPWWKRLFGR